MKKSVAISCVFTILFAVFVITAAQTKERSKVLVVYYSKSGNTQRVAEDIRAGLDADIERIMDKKDRSGFTGAVGAGKDATFNNSTEIGAVKFNPSDYDLVIIGTPVWSWSITPAVRAYITAYKDQFKQVAFFNTAGGTTIDKIAPDLEKLAGKKAIALTGFVEEELKPENKTNYEKKIREFVAAVKLKLEMKK